ncbi:MAG: TetR/AcrR family transcriptional regulator, partial [Mycobacterium sp.]
MSDAGSTRRRRAISKEDKLKRRGEIMTAAKTVFARNGFHATTIAHIAKEAGLAYGSVYWYFDSKDELFHALMAAEGEALRAHIAAAVGTDGRRTEKDWEPLRVTVQAVLEFFEADRAVTKLLLRDAYALGDQFEKHLGSIYEGFIDDIEKQMIV